MKEQIKKYLDNGFNCIPVNADKTPAIDWKIYQSEKVSDLSIFKTNSIAIICGKISDNLTVFDFDNHNGTAKENLTNFIQNPLISEIYNKHKLPVISTQSGGYHIYVRCDIVKGNLKLAQVKLNGHPDTIIETRGEGGYVLAPPTPNYKLIKNQIENLQYIDNNEFEIMLEVAKSFNQYNKPNEVFKPKLDNETPWHIYDLKPESIIEAKQILQSIGWTELSYNNAWCRPGKKRGVSATFGKVAPNVFYVFSSNCDYFESEKAYTPFSIKALVKYSGDFSALAKELAREYGLNKQQTESPKIEVKSNFDLNEIYKDCKIDFDAEYILPTVIVKFKEDRKWLDICSLGNFSAFTGKSKARKSFASYFLQAGCISNKWIQDKFIIDMPENKRNVIYFDTEQSPAHVARSTIGIVKLANVSKLDNYQVFALRKYSYLDRCKIIEEIIDNTKNLGVVFIDGIADLAFGNNDENEASRVSQLLLTWTTKYDIHINTVIHQTKSNDWATGHLGSAIEKKAESVISIKKEGQYSIFEPKQLRNCEDFTPFPFLINSERLPELITDRTIIENLLEDEI
jgi:hypothetical protein